jgi:hypothetical protein
MAKKLSSHLERRAAAEAEDQEADGEMEQEQADHEADAFPEAFEDDYAMTLDNTDPDQREEADF